MPTSFKPQYWSLKRLSAFAGRPMSFVQSRLCLCCTLLVHDATCMQVSSASMVGTGSAFDSTVVTGSGRSCTTTAGCCVCSRARHRPRLPKTGCRLVNERFEFVEVVVLITKLSHEQNAAYCWNMLSAAAATYNLLNKHMHIVLLNCKAHSTRHAPASRWNLRGTCT